MCQVCRNIHRSYLNQKLPVNGCLLQILIDAVVHAVNKDYEGMAGDFVNLGFLSSGTDVAPIIPALENIWEDSLGQSLADFNFRTVTSKFNELVFQYPIRIPERYSLVIRSLLTQEGICMTLDKSFHFLEVAYPYVAKRLLTDETLRERLIQVWGLVYLRDDRVHTLYVLLQQGPADFSWAQVSYNAPLCEASINGGFCLVVQVLFQDGRFQWDRLENLINLAKEGTSMGSLDLSATAKDALKVLLVDDKLRGQLVAALTEDDRLHVEEVRRLLALLQDDVDMRDIMTSIISDFPSLSRQAAVSWSDKVLSS